MPGKRERERWPKWQDEVGSLEFVREIYTGVPHVYFFFFGAAALFFLFKANKRYPSPVSFVVAFGIVGDKLVGGHLSCVTSSGFVQAPKHPKANQGSWTNAPNTW